MKKVRTLTELRKGLKGRVYIYLENDKICKKFLENADKEGFTFGGRRICDSDGSNIIALEHGKQLSYVGFVGHMAFQCNGGDNHNGFYRIDYSKFVDGSKDYLYKADNRLQMIEIQGKYYDEVTIIGDNYVDASKYIKQNLLKCKNIHDEEILYSTASEKFNVLILEE